MRLFDAAYEADSSGPGRGCVERERRGRCVVSQPKLQLQLEFNVNNCLQLHLFICTPFAQLPHLPQPPWLPTVPYPSWCCPLSLLLMMLWWWCVACACACAGQLAIGFGWRPCRLVSLWFAFHLCMRPGHVYYFISFHFISFEFFPSPARFIMIIMFYSTIDAQIGSCLDHLQLYTRGGRQQQQQKQRVGSLSGDTRYASGV